MAYMTILTTRGLTAMASAEALGTRINLTHMAVGDGGGNAVTPSESQTNLVRELFRAPVNRVFQDPVQPNKFTAELVIPASVGGFVLREVGIVDSNGSLFAVGNLPETYKPTPSDGAFSDTVVRLEFLASNSSVVTLQIDPHVAVATQVWVTNNVTAASILAGGTTGQVLSKHSNTDGDIIWADPDVANVVVDCIEEPQTLAAAQTVVTWSTVTTRGLAVYINGERLTKGTGIYGWQENPANLEKSIILGQSYPAGTRIVGTQNEPAGNAPFPLQRDLNLSDVPDKALARNNLEIYSKPETDTKAPSGMVGYFARATPPTGWLKANGAAVSRVAYAALFAAIGTTYGAGNGFDTFNLPDLRGEFLRGWDDGRGIDGGRNFGTVQSGSIQSHDHSATSADGGGHAHAGNASNAGSHSHAASSGNAGSHGHAGTADTAGSHVHAASSDTAGSHGHTGSVSAAGTHTHGIVVDENGLHNHANGIYDRLLRAPYEGSLTGNDVTGSGYEQAVGPGDSANIAWSGAHDHLARAYDGGAHNHSLSIDGNGSHQHSVSVSANGNHSHALSVNAGGEHSHTVSVGTDGAHGHAVSIDTAGSHSHAVTVGSTGSAETRPRNVALLACIKF